MQCTFHGYVVVVYTVITYIVMACIVMAYIVVACIVMAYIVVAYIVIACIVMAYIVSVAVSGNAMTTFYGPRLFITHYTGSHCRFL